MNRRAKTFLSSISVIALLFFNACGGGGSSDEDQPEYIRFVNGLVDEDRIEASLGTENPEQTFVSFGRDSGYLNAEEGDEVPLRIRPSGSVIPAISETVAIESGKAYSYYVVDVAGVVKGTLLEDPNELEDNTIANTRVFNAGFSSETLDVYITFADPDLDEEDPVITGAKYNEVTDGIIFDSGTYSVTVTKTGSKTALVTDRLTFDGGESYTLVVFQDKDGGAPYTVRLLRHS